MYFDHRQTLDWAGRVAAIVADQADRLEEVQVVVFPGFASLEALARVFAGGSVRLGAQNLASHERGAFTGEVPAAALAQVGCAYVEIGHAERRRLFAEGDVEIQGKLASAFRHRLTPLLCVGEPVEGSAEAAGAYCLRQLEATLGQVGPEHGPRPLVVAYEPVWAIGADRPASVAHIAQVCAALRDWLARRRPGGRSLVVYGGSAGPGLLARLGAQVDGLFLGRSAHDPQAFGKILSELSGCRPAGAAAGIGAARAGPGRARAAATVAQPKPTSTTSKEPS
jgi:triosephosphate isomerase